MTDSSDFATTILVKVKRSNNTDELLVTPRMLAHLLDVEDRTVRNANTRAKAKHDPESRTREPFTEIDAAFLEGYKPTPGGYHRWTRAGAILILKAHGRAAPKEWV